MKQLIADKLQEIINGDYGEPFVIAGRNYYLIEKTSYSFYFYCTIENASEKLDLYEVLYDLRYKKYYLIKNGKLLSNTHQSWDKVIPRRRQNGDKFYTVESRDRFFEFVSVEENVDMYKTMTLTIGKLGFEKVNMTARALLRLIEDFNALELLYKSGINPEVIEVGKTQGQVLKASKEGVTKVHNILEITKAQLKFLKEFVDLKDIGYWKWKNYVHHIAAPTPQDMNLFRGYIKVIKELEVKYGCRGKVDAFLTDYSAEFEEFLEHCHERNRIEEGSTTHSYGHSFFRFIQQNEIENTSALLEYLMFKCHFSQGIDKLQTALNLYRDYYRMSKSMNRKFEKYPRFLKTKHDIVAMNYKLVKSEIMQEKFKEVATGLKHYSTKLKDFSIVVPDELDSVVEEGNNLNHCVASYVENIVDKQTVILFLRGNDKLDESLVTVEVKGNRVVQAYGQSNRVVTRLEKTALEQFSKKHNLREMKI